MAELEEQVRSCCKCRLHCGAQNAVPGEGPTNAKLMLIGQNPGAEEDKTGRPFIGRSGKFLDKILAKNGINRQSLFITSVVKHKSPNNRNPTQDEIAACLPYLNEQIQIIKPQFILLMGTTAWQTPRVAGINYFETYHPSAAMRFTKIRQRFEQDIKTLSQKL